MLDREAVDDLAADADVLVHLAFIILGGREETRSINLEGSRNVFEAARGVHAARLHLVGRRLRLPRRQPAAAHRGRPRPAAPTRTTTRRRRRSSRTTLRDALDGLGRRGLRVPAVHRGRRPDALTLVEAFPALVRQLPVGPVLPDPGTPFQLVHPDDVAGARRRRACAARASPASTTSPATARSPSRDLARALGWLSFPVPRIGVAAAAEAVNRLPLMPPQASWINAMRVPVVMDTARAREQLGWAPRHDTRATLAATAAGRARARPRVGTTAPSGTGLPYRRTQGRSAARRGGPAAKLVADLFRRSLPPQEPPPT